MSITAATEVLAEIRKLQERHRLIIYVDRGNGGLAWQCGNESGLVGPEMDDETAEAILDDVAKTLGLEIGPCYALTIR